MPGIRGGQIQDDSVESVDIKDGTITNSDISTSASIDHTKLNISWKPPVANATALPISGNQTGDIITVIDSQRAYIWSGSSWDEMAMTGYSSTTFDADFASKTTDGLSEGSVNKYFVSHNNDYHSEDYFTASGGVLSGGIEPVTSDTYNLGSNLKRWNEIHCKDLYTSASTIHLGTDTISVVNGKIDFSKGISIPAAAEIETDIINITSINPADTATIFGSDNLGDSTLHIRIGNGTDDKISFESFNGSAASSLMSIDQSNVTISGNLIVSGTTTTVNSTTVEIEDASFVIGNSTTAIDKDGTFEVKQATGSAVIKYNNTSNEWEIGDSSTTVPIYSARTSQASGRFDTSATDPTSSNRLNYDGYLYATRVYNAVYNDFADFQPLAEDEELRYGRAYYHNAFSLHMCNKRCQASVVGIASDTHGQAVGYDSTKYQVPIAVAGWVLAVVDKRYKSGVPLVNAKSGSLTKATLFERVFRSERIIAIYQRPEYHPTWKDVDVNGRHWVKVK